MSAAVQKKKGRQSRVGAGQLLLVSFSSPYMVLSPRLASQLPGSGSPRAGKVPVCARGRNADVCLCHWDNENNRADFLLKSVLFCQMDSPRLTDSVPEAIV